MDLACSLQIYTHGMSVMDFDLAVSGLVINLAISKTVNTNKLS